jgi:hypothetical protein
MSKGLVAAAAVEFGIITWRDVHALKTLPIPADYVGATIVFGGLGLLPDRAQPAAAAFGWVFVLATLLNLWNPTAPGNITGKAGGTPAKAGSSGSSSSGGLIQSLKDGLGAAVPGLSGILGGP